MCVCVCVWEGVAGDNGVTVGGGADINRPTYEGGTTDCPLPRT